ncbi:acyltransferase family protein [Lachnospiraceae bacterium 62-35]
MKNVRYNYGLDLLKITAMFYVVILHALARWGFLDDSISGTPQYYLAWLMEAAAYCAVDCFALITGFVYYNEKPVTFKLSSLILLWLQIVFYGTVNLLLKILFGVPFVENEVRLVLLPLISNTYWYFTAYVGLYFFIPVIICGVHNLDNQTLKIVVLFAFILFTAGETYTGNFRLESGYSLVWLIIMCWGGKYKKA